MLQGINYQQLAKTLLQTGLTTAELGRRIGLSQPAVSRLAAGLTGTVSAEVGVRLIVLAGGQVHLPPELIGGEPAAVTGNGTSQDLPLETLGDQPAATETPHAA